MRQHGMLFHSLTFDSVTMWSHETNSYWLRVKPSDLDHPLVRPMPQYGIRRLIIFLILPSYHND
jgi:hypothetical protein